MPLLSMNLEKLCPLSVYAGTSFLYCQFEKDNGSFSPAHRFDKNIYIPVGEIIRISLRNILTVG